jgi:CRISPR system Cascade subunit CasA
MRQAPKVRRSLHEAKGLTGDPWTPIETGEGEAKALTIDARGFSYRRMSDILFSRGFAPAPLQTVSTTEDMNGAPALVARAFVRGQGKTEGLHERRILATRKIVRLLADGRTTEADIPAKRRRTGGSRTEGIAIRVDDVVPERAGRVQTGRPELR